MKNKITYWTSTGIISLMMLFSAYSYLTNIEIKAAFLHLGFPDYFRVELGIAKLIGALVLILPFVPKSFKTLGYFGFAITFISATIAHVSSGDPSSAAIMPLIFLAVLAVSFYSYQKLSVPETKTVDMAYQID